MSKHTATLRPMTYPRENPYFRPGRKQNDSLGQSLLTLEYTFENCCNVRRTWTDSSSVDRKHIAIHYRDMAKVYKKRETAEEMQRRYDFISKLQLQKREGKLHCATTLDELEKQDALPGFNRWPILPNEIQRMIWIAALPGPRTVTVSPEGGGPLPRTAEQERYIAMTDSKIASSGMHAACRESRKVYLQFYKREFEGQFRNPLFFDLGVDSLYLPDRIAMACLEGDRKGQLYVPKINEPHKTWRPKLRHLIVGPFFHQGRSGLRAAAFLTSLETLVMEAPGIVNEIFRMTFHGSKAQMKKEIMRQLDELWARQVADGTREKMPVVQWITSRNLLRKIKAEKDTI